jgi:hypothetical protein
VDTTHLPEFPARFADAIRRRAGWPEDASLEEIHAIDQHGMLPLVYRWSGNRSLRDAALRAAALETLQIETLREVLDALNERGVTPLIAKGTALAYSIYPSPDLRPRTDVDLLIDERDFGAVRAAFASRGFGETPSSGVRQHMFYRVDVNRIMQSYDVHLDITNNATTADTLWYDDLRARAVPLPAISQHALAPSPVDSLLYACIHRVVHHHASDRLIWLYDVHLLREGMAPEQRRELWMRAAERRVVAISRQSIAQAQELFGGDVDDATEFLSTFDENEPSRAFLEPHRSGAAVLAGDLAALSSWPARFRRVGQLAFPSAEYMLQSFGVRSRVALPVLYVWRGLRGVGRLFRRN